MHLINTEPVLLALKAFRMHIVVGWGLAQQQPGAQQVRSHNIVLYLLYVMPYSLGCATRRTMNQTAFNAIQTAWLESWLGQDCSMG